MSFAKLGDIFKRLVKALCKILLIKKDVGQEGKSVMLIEKVRFGIYMKLNL